MPSSNRPPLNQSTVAASLASSTAGRSGAIRIPVLSTVRRVAAAIAPSSTSGSG
jgi:hypothetical protein